MTTVIYHNPRCSKSRQTLGILEEQGIEPTVIKYLDTPPDAATLRDILQQLGITPRELMRTKEQEYKTQQLNNENLTDEQLIQAMITTPKLIERPIVIANNKAIIGRPPENVLAIL